MTYGNQHLKKSARWLDRATGAILMIAALAAPSAAQTFAVLHKFSGTDGAIPKAGLSLDGRGRLYGTTEKGGILNCGDLGCGTVFRLAPQGNNWVLTPLWKFAGPSDGALPDARPVFGPGGLLYGTTDAGGEQFCEGTGCGLAYSLRPGATACTSALCLWSENRLYSFGGVNDICQGISSGMGPHKLGSPGGGFGSCPGLGDVIFDQAGNMYGTIPCCYGAVYKLAPDGTATLVYAFAGGADGEGPEAGVIFDHAGNLYGTTVGGGSENCGTIYELSPNGSGWAKTTLYSFKCGSDGINPYGGVILDAAGNLYGTTNFLGDNNGGTVYELSPSGGGSWSYQVIYALPYNGTFDFLLYGPTGSLAMDSTGSLYGTTVLDGQFGEGNVFKLTPSAGGGWTYTSLHDFRGFDDGGQPFGNLVLDGSGNVYGTASVGGNNNDCESFGCGTAWRISQ